jgi:hypothetical protein
MADLAEHFAAALEHDRFGVALERIAEGIIGGEEEPGVAAVLSPMRDNHTLAPTGSTAVALQ